MKAQTKRLLARVGIWALIIAPLSYGYLAHNEAAANVGWLFLLVLTALCFVVSLACAATVERLDDDFENTGRLVFSLSLLQRWDEKSAASWWFTTAQVFLVAVLAAANDFLILATVYLWAESMLLVSFKRIVSEAAPHARYWFVKDGVLHPKNPRKSDSELQRQATTSHQQSRSAQTAQATATRNDMTDPLNPLSPFSQLHPLNPMAHHIAPDINCSTRRSYDPSPSCSGSSSYSSSSDSSSSSSSSSSCSGGCGSSD